MSKRFGRNQKRKLREQNAHLWGALEIRDKQYRDVLLQLVRLTRQHKEAVMLIADTNAAIKRQFNEWHPLANKVRSEQVMSPELREVRMALIDKEPNSIHAYTTQTLFMIELEGWPTDYRNAMCFEMRYGQEKRSRYYATNLDIIQRAAVIETYGKEIATLLLNHLVGK